MKTDKLNRGEVVVIPPDEAERYKGKLQLVDMKNSKYRVLESFERQKEVQPKEPIKVNGTRKTTDKG